MRGIREPARRAEYGCDAARYLPDREREHDTWITVELSHDLTGYRAVIAARGRRQGTRTLADVGPTCANIAAAVAITLVVLLDPDVPRTLDVPRVPVVPPRAEVRAVPPLPAPTPLPSRPVAVGAEAHGGVALGVLQHAALLLEGGTRLDLAHRFSLGAGGGVVLPERAPFGGGTVELSLAYAYLHGGFWLLESHGEGRLAAVAGSVVGSLAGDATGFEHHSARHLFFGAALAGGELFTTLTSHFAWSARALLMLPYLREGFSVVGTGGASASFRVPAVGGVITTGLSATF